MNEKIAKIRQKIVRLENFFEDIAKEFRKEMKIEYLYFLMINERTGNFVTKYSTGKGNICLAKKELNFLVKNENEEIIFPEMEFKSDSRLIVKRTLLTKVKWKIRLHKVHALMPLYYNGKMICLILFRKRSSGHWPNNSYDFLKEIKKEIEYYLASILLYNQALDGVMKKCMALD